MSSFLNVLFFVRRVGPYHHARFQEATRTMNLIVIETRPLSEEYPWDFSAVRNYQSYNFPSGTNLEHGIRGKYLSKIISDVFDRFNPHVVVTTGWADAEYHAVILESSNRKIPRIVISDSRYEDEPRIFYKEWVKRIILRGYSIALVAGSSSYNYLVQLGFPSSYIYKPWDVVDNSYFGSAALTSSVKYADRYFICVSRFIHKKNISGLIAAYSKYKTNGGTRKLVLLGSGELEATLRGEISTLSLKDDILLHGFVQYDSLKNFLSKSFSLILPSFTDQWGLVVNEAMASALPVIVSSNCGCARDLISHTKNGYTFDAQSVPALAKVMLDVDRLNETEWREMAVNSRNTIDKWDLSNFKDGLLNACEQAYQVGSRPITGLLHRILQK